MDRQIDSRKVVCCSTKLDVDKYALHVHEYLNCGSKRSCFLLTVVEYQYHCFCLLVLSLTLVGIRA